MAGYYPTFTEEELSNEIWKLIPDYEGFYSVSNLGRFRRNAGYRCRLPRILHLKAHPKHGHVIVNLCLNNKESSYIASSLIASVFIGKRPSGLILKHKDENKQNNRVSNLEYAERQYEFRDLLNQRFNRLLVTKYMGRQTFSEKLLHYWQCLCDCGRIVEVASIRLLSGSTSSCGCYRISRAVQAIRKHGMSYSPIYRVYVTMKNRCYKKTSNGYENYGGRGIKVCDRWLESFENFYQDMGERPSAKHTLERINNDGDYCPENCRWATRTEQNRNNRRNQMVTFNGETMCVSAWAEKLQISESKLRRRLTQWSLEKAMTTR